MPELTVVKSWALPQFDPTPDEARTLAEIRTRESSGDYAARNPKPGSTAAGAYQFIGPTWQLATKNTGAPVYSSAAEAPQVVQDANALHMLRQYGPNSTTTWAASGPYKAPAPAETSQAATAAPLTVVKSWSVPPTPPAPSVLDEAKRLGAIAANATGIPLIKDTLAGFGKTVMDSIVGAPYDPRSVEQFKSGAGAILGGIAGEPERIRQELIKSGDAMTRGDINEAANHLWFAIPMLGAAGAGMAEYLKRGDIKGALAHAAGSLAPFAAEPTVTATKGAIKALPEAVETTGAVTKAAVKAGGRDVAVGAGKTALGAALAKAGPLGEIGDVLAGVPVIKSGLKQMGRGVRAGYSAGKQALADQAVAPPAAAAPVVEAPPLQLGPGPVIPPAPPDASYVRGVPAQYAQPEPVPPSRQLGPGPIVTPPPPDASFVRAVPAEYPPVEFTPQEQALADHILQNVEPQAAPTTPPPATAAAAAPKPAAAEIAQQFEATTRPDRMVDFLKRMDPEISAAAIDNLDPNQWELVARGAGSPAGTIPTAEDIAAVRGSLAQSEGASQITAKTPEAAKAEFEQKRTTRKGPATATAPAPAASEHIANALQEIEAKFPVNPDNPTERVLIAQGKPAATFQIEPRGDRLRLRTMRSVEPQSGVGSIVLDRIIRAADKHGVTLELTASPYGPEAGRIGKDALVRWYESRGFRQEPGFDPALGYMTREPNAKPSAQTAAEFMRGAPTTDLETQLADSLAGKRAAPPPEGTRALTAAEERVEAYAQHFAPDTENVTSQTLEDLPKSTNALLQLERLGERLGIKGRPASLDEVQQIVDRVRQLRGEAPQTLRTMMEGEKPAATAAETLPAAKQPWQMSESEWEAYKQANVPEFVEAGLEYKQHYAGKHETIRGVWKDALDVLENPDKRISEWGKTYRDTVNKADAWLEQHPDFAKSHEQHIAEAVQSGETLSPENARTYSDVIAATRKDMERAAEPVRPPAPSPRKRRSK